jgi:CBS-domain-containing membrane protein
LIFAFIGGFVTIFVLTLITNISELIFIMAPFGASCVLAFAAWEAPLAQPRNIIGGHFISALIGLIVLQLFGNQPWTVALAVGLAISIMVLTKTTHPPAGADPIVIITTSATWNFLLFPVLIGSIILTIIAIMLNRFLFKRGYPKFWY